jgi:hypothetical protein
MAKVAFLNRSEHRSIRPCTPLLSSSCLSAARKVITASIKRRSDRFFGSRGCCMIFVYSVTRAETGNHSTNL